MRIDPHAWLLTVPLTIALVQIWFLPANHAVKRVWQQLQEMETEIWFRLNRGMWSPDDPETAIPGAAWIKSAAAYQFLIGFFAVLSLLSFAAFVGLLPH